MEKTCVGCGNKYITRRGKKKYCTWDCCVAHRVPYNRVGITKDCVLCGKSFGTKPSHFSRRMYCSRRCAHTGKPSNMSGKHHTESAKFQLRMAHLGRRGPSHWNWKNGSVDRKQRHTDMQRDEYKQWRMAVFTRDNFTCRICGASKVQLNADHIIPWAVDESLRYEVSNGQTLCVPCHKETPTYGGRVHALKEMRA